LPTVSGRVLIAALLLIPVALALVTGQLSGNGWSYSNQWATAGVCYYYYYYHYYPSTCTTIAITQLTGRVGTVTVNGYLKDGNGRGVPRVPVRILVDGQNQATTTTDLLGRFFFSGSGPTMKGLHWVTVVFDGNFNYAPSKTTRTYQL